MENFKNDCLFVLIVIAWNVRAIAGIQVGLTELGALEQLGGTEELAQIEVHADALDVVGSEVGGLGLVSGLLSDTEDAQGFL